MDPDSIQRQIKPFSPRTEDQQPARLFQDVRRSESDVPPLDTISDRRMRGTNGLVGHELQSFWTEVFRAENLSLEDLYPFRLQAAWRVSREWCLLLGLISQPNQSLPQVLQDADPSPWLDRDFAPENPSLIPDSFVRAIYGEAKGLPLSPPQPPRVALARPDYEPSRDKRLVLWCRAFTRIAMGRLGLQVRQDGRYGMAGLTEPDYARIAMPTPGEIYAFEELIVGRALTWLVESSIHETNQKLMEIYGLRDHEARQVLAMAQDSATRYTGINLEAARSVLIMRLEKLLGDAQSALNTRDAVFVIRELSRLRGLVKDSQSESTQTVEHMVKVIKDVEKRDRKQLPPPPNS